MKYVNLLILLAACNAGSEKTDGNEMNRVQDKTSKARPEENAAPCSGFYWFKKGTVARFADRDGKGKQFNTTTTTITGVQQQGSVTTASFVSSFSDKSSDISGEFKCEDGKVMMDIGSLFKNEKKHTGMTMEMSKGGWLSFPAAMKAGDQLERTPYEMKAMKDGRVVMTMTSLVNSRVVEAKEKISTPAGSWEAFRITEVRTMEMSMPGSDKKMPGQSMKYTYWFVPSFGIVRNDFTDASGQLLYRSELISIK